MKESIPTLISMFLFSTGFTMLLLNGDYGVALVLAAIGILIVERV